MNFWPVVNSLSQWVLIPVGNLTSGKKDCLIKFLLLLVEVGRADLDAIIKYRDQLWAEGRALFLQKGILYQEAETLGTKEHGKYMLKDPWQDAVEEWLKEPDMLTEEKQVNKPYLKTGDVLRGALKMEPKNIKRSDEMRMAKILKAIGYERKVVREGKKLLKVYMKNLAT